MSLFTLQSPGGYGGAQRLVPNESGLIDIHGQYPWTLSPNNVKQYIPYIELQEFRQNFSSEIVGLVQNLAGNAQNALLAGGIGTGTAAGEYLATVLGGKLLIGGAAGAASAASRLLERIPIAGGFLKQQAEVLIASGVGATRALTQTYAGINVAQNTLDSINKNISPDMDPYVGLYSATPTGFTYKIPYLSVDNFMKAGGSWGAANEKGVAQGGLEAVRTYLTRGASRGDAVSGPALAQTGYDAADAFDKILKGIVGGAPGVAAEVLKAFTPAADGDSIKVTFYLSNTFGSEVNQILKNWQFLYLLTYQNLPNRRSINLLDPPCLYRVRIPGVKAYPVAIIDSLTVTNEGTSRKVNITTGEISKEDGPDVKLIPEVYKVTLSIKSLLTSTQNIFAYSQANQEKVTVITDKFSVGSALSQATRGQIAGLAGAEKFFENNSIDTPRL